MTDLVGPKTRIHFDTRTELAVRHCVEQSVSSEIRLIELVLHTQFSVIFASTRSQIWKLQGKIQTTKYKAPFERPYSWEYQRSLDTHDN